MEKHACKLCSRKFPSGKALGGHMRAHIAAIRARERALLDSPASSSFSPRGGSSSVVLPDGDSETESYRIPQLRRSKRGRFGEEHPELELGSSSSVSNSTPEEEVARSLMRLSRDVWWREEQREEKKKKRIHQCSICSRIFNSGQALGGHKRAHMMYHSSPEVAEKEKEEEEEEEEESVKSGGRVNFDLNEPPGEEGESSSVSHTRR